MAYVIRWECSCGVSGYVQATSEDTAWRDFDRVQERHENHRDLSWIGEEVEQQ